MLLGTDRIQGTCIVIACCALLLTLVNPNVGQAQVARVEAHPFPSMTVSDQEFLTGRKDGKPVILAGQLRIPRLGKERFPAMILVHGSGGPAGNVDDWAQYLNQLGVATFILDSFTGRGLESGNLVQLERLAMIVDIYRVLELLARHPRIDRERIAAMGFSRGGIAVLYSSLRRFQRMHGPSSGPELAAFIAFYPLCNTTYLNDDDVSDKPIRIFHGTADDWLPVAPCRSYVERLRKAGKDVQLTEYPDAQHVFDWPMRKIPLRLAKARTQRRCRLEEGDAGRILNSETKEPFSVDDPCVERGVTLAYQPQAHSEARRAIAEFVATSLKAK